MALDYTMRAIDEMTANLGGSMEIQE